MQSLIQLSIGKYGISFVGELLFLPDFVKPLPLCGHLWFMQSLMLWLVRKLNKLIKISKLFINPKISTLLFVIVIMCGFVYRGVELIYVFSYL
jgi:hypothetical protein